MVEFIVKKEMEKFGILIAFASALMLCEPCCSYSSTCFVNRTITKIPSSHIYHWVSKPAIIGYKGHVMAHQENTLEGINKVIGERFQGVHMQVQATFDDVLILFGDKNLKRLTGVNAPIRYLKYEAIAGLQIQKEIHVVGNLTLRYSKTAGIPRLEDVLNAIRGKGLLIYIELVPSDAPPESPLERDHSLRVGRAVAKLVRKLNMINDVFVVSSDPFKMLAVNYQDSDIVTGWWFKKEFYVNATIKRMRKEFIDLQGLRDCYRKTAPTGLEFAPFLYETGIVTKSVNGSLFDASFDFVNSAAYFSGRNDKTLDVLKKNYNPNIHYGTLLTYFESQIVRNKKADNTKLHILKKNGMDRIITDDPRWVREVLTAIGSSGFAISANVNMVIYCIVGLITVNRYF